MEDSSVIEPAIDLELS